MRGSALQTEFLSGAFGARVRGVNIAEGLAPDTIQELIDLLYRKRIVVIPDQRLEFSDYAEFGEHWGNPLLFHDAKRRAGDFPTIIKISNAPNRAHESKDGAAHWHSDSSYETVPASVTMLYAVEVPRAGGETLFADTIAAYAGLDEHTKSRIANLEVIHRMGSAPRLDEEVPQDPSIDLSRFAVVRHPLVYPHPVTGEPALFLSGTSWQIDGWSEAHSHELLLDLRRHLVKPEFRQSYKAEVGDILIWDNFATVHSATPLAQSDQEGERRLLYRISTKGNPALVKNP